MTAKKAKKDCCEKSKDPKEAQKDCEGKCGHLNCTTSTVQLSLPVWNEIEFKSNSFDFRSEKQKFYHNETSISSGFYSVWLPPKIV
ncbi:hypothetical protein [Flavobacterium sp.]|uniref:hypothetical protein n=1 Tax=Flavobacterium sp. TaxID=239 RepID=UPI003D6C0615